jgi:cobyrinic acid a,c-diamide synthase
MLGAELVLFSPLYDERLPENIDGLYIGGGYPEIWAEELQNNLSMRENIKSHVENGLPAYAECVGLMYLTDSIRTKDNRGFSGRELESKELGNKEFEDREYEMVGLLPGKSSMTTSLKRFGYVYVKLIEDTILGKKGSEIRAHEFHYSDTEIDKKIKPCFEVTQRRDGLTTQLWSCGFKIHNLLAGYAHMHFWSNPEFAKGLVESCSEYKNSRGFKI